MSATSAISSALLAEARERRAGHGVAPTGPDPERRTNTAPLGTDRSDERRPDSKKTGDRLRGPPAAAERVSRVILASAADAHACPIVAMRRRAHVSRAVVPVGPVRDNRAARTHAPGPIRAGGAGGGVSLGRLNGEKAKNQQGGSNQFHRWSPQDWIHMPSKDGAKLYAAPTFEYGARPSCRDTAICCPLRPSPWRPCSRR